MLFKTTFQHWSWLPNPISQHLVASTLKLRKLLWLQTPACSGRACKYSWRTQGCLLGLQSTEAFLPLMKAYTIPNPVKQKMTHYSSAKPSCQGADKKLPGAVRREAPMPRSHRPGSGFSILKSRVLPRSNWQRWHQEEPWTFPWSQFLSWEKWEEQT